ncbi:MAG: MaoC family dehydratase [Kofleriaceae bacterium]
MAHATAPGGHFFEDFSVGQRFQHPTPRTLHGGDLSLYIGLTGDRRPLSSSTEFSRSLGYARECAHDLLGFHVVFGKTVGAVSHNAIANLGYAQVLFPRPIYPGDTLTAETEVVGVRELSDGKRGIVYVSSRGYNQKGQEVISFIRWVMVPKRDPAAPAPAPVIPTFPAVVPPERVPVPDALNLARFPDLRWATGGARLWGDYAVGERLIHGGGMTIEDADHMLATRLYQNSARVHFDGHGAARTGGRRLVYGGHVISVAHALAWDGLENVLKIAAWNAGSHVNPTYGGDTVYAWSEVLDRAELPGRKDLGALRLRLVAVTNVDPAVEEIALQVPRPDGKAGYDPRVVLDLDWWGLIPR